MVHTSMQDLMLGMFWGGVLLALPPVMIGLGLAAYLLQQRRREQSQESLHDRPGE